MPSLLRATCAVGMFLFMTACGGGGGSGGGGEETETDTSPPSTQGESVTTNEDTPVTIDVLANDEDTATTSGTTSGVITQAVDSSTVTVETPPANGNATVNGSTGEITYAPNSDFNGTDSFTYTVEDDAGNTSDPATVDLTINPVNDPPVFIAGSDQTVPEDSGAQAVNGWATGIGTGAANETGQSITGFNVSNDNNALFAAQPAIDNAGNLTWTGGANANGSATVIVSLSDDGGTSNGGSDTSPDQTFTITITAVSDVPNASDDSLTVDEDAPPTTVDILANDDFGGDGPSGSAVTVTSAPSNGTAMVDDNGTVADPSDDAINYEPDADFFGSDSFDYTIEDADGDTDTATVSVTVNAVDDAPSASGDSLTVDEDGPAMNVDVLANDDFGGDGPSSSAISVTNAPENGTATVDDNGTASDPTDDSIDYQPDADYNGPDGFDYQIEDSDGDTATATVSVTVDSVNDLPSASDDSLTVDENDSPTNVDVLANDDFGGDGPSGSAITVTSAPSNGTATVNDNGTAADPTDDSIDYEAEAEFFGSDSFDYTIEDADGDTATATVSVTVNEVSVTWQATTTSGAPDARGGHTAVWTGREMIVWGGIDGRGFEEATGGRYDPVTNSWTATAVGPQARRFHSAIWSGREMVVWGGRNSSGRLDSGSRYDPVTDGWTATTTTNAPTARDFHTAVWTGREMVIWGGFASNTGGRYDPTTDNWSATSTTNVPSERQRHTAVWTGREMVVWGGRDGFGNVLASGGRYNPVSDTWTATTSTSAPIARRLHSVTWTGRVMIVWGGLDSSDNRLDSGGRYDPVADSWSATATASTPTGRFGHTVVWTGKEMLVWGGRGASSTKLNSGGRYDPVADNWTATSTTSVPTARDSHVAVWSGREMIIWGGRDSNGDVLNFGGRLDIPPESDTWNATTTINAPTGRERATAVWTGGQMIVWGGYDGNFLNTGGVYDPVTDTWSATDTTGAPDPRTRHTGVWTGREMIVWGGSNFDTVGDMNSGGRYDPISDSWSATVTSSAPSARRDHTAVWTGREMLVWGGFESSGQNRVNTGALYDPAADTWTATTTSNAPVGRHTHSAIWTGGEMIVWGGIDSNNNTLQTGGRYDPVVDQWTATTTTAAPAARFRNTAIWTGREMIVWGGEDSINGTKLGTGGRYDAVTNTWIATQSSSAPSARTFHTAVWTGREMVVWGGSDSGGATDTGARLDPVTSSWSAVSTIDAPTARVRAEAVWTGPEMIVWGGLDQSANQLNTGGRYEP